MVGMVAGVFGDVLLSGMLGGQSELMADPTVIRHNERNGLSPRVAAYSGLSMLNSVIETSTIRPAASAAPA